MLLCEIPKTEPVVISFDIGIRHFDFTVNLMADADNDDAQHVIFSEVVLIKGIAVHIDGRCRNVELKYLNQQSGRTHVWKNVSVQYEETPAMRYRIECQLDSIPVNRRRAVRISINSKTECVVSLLDGKYPCVTNDVSVTGIGLNIDIALARKKLYHRLIYTYFEDDVLEKRFFIKARCLHCTELDEKTVRCGCEIIQVTPSINEYINMKQTHRLAKAAVFDENGNFIRYRDENGNKLPEKTKKSTVDKPEEKISESKKEERPPVVWVKPRISRQERNPYLYEDAPCPVCGEGRLYRSMNCWICDECASMLE